MGFNLPITGHFICIHLSIFTIFMAQKRLQGKKILITAGPTREPLDQVRYIANQSTGKIENKNFDMVVLHSIGDFHAGSDERNKIIIIKKDLTPNSYPLINIKKAAGDVLRGMSMAASAADLTELEEQLQGYEMMYR